jgi:SAM-dependent methyltransferase
MAIKSALQKYFIELYEHTKTRLYQDARRRIAASLSSGGYCLDCGAGGGHQLQYIKAFIDLPQKNYFGIEWGDQSLARAKQKGLQVVQGDLNRNLPFDSGVFQCVFGLSVLEHLVNGCNFLKEARRVLRPKGHFIIITPNLSAWFNVVLLAMGRMPSSGPHPDSEILLKKNNLVSSTKKKDLDLEGDTPSDRHLVVFTYKTLYDYMKLLGFRKIFACTYGYYPFPKVIQQLLEKLDPWHCHQLLFDCEL